MQQNLGFTIIELVITLAITAILAALALPAYHDYLVRAQVSEGLHVAAGARAAVWEYSSSFGHLPTSNSSAGLPIKEAIRGKYVTEVEVVATGIQVTYGNEASLAIHGETLILAPTLSSRSGTVNWTCSGGTVSTRYRSTGCS